MGATKWRRIANNYEVSSAGAVRKNRATFMGHTFTNVTVKPHRSGKYLRIRVPGPRPRYVYIHRAVATAFLRNPKKYRYVIHRNGKTQDNRVENLRWASSPPCNKPPGWHPRTKLTPRDVQRVRAKARLGLTQKAIADQFNVCPSLISRILAGHRWS